MTYKTFEDLEAWKRSRIVRIEVSRVVKSWPKEERYLLTSQILRSSRSPCANIAEGFGRYYEKDNARFCRTALGSLQETKNHIGNALEEGYVSNDQHELVRAACTQAIVTVIGYMRYLQRLSAGSSAVGEPSSEMDEMPFPEG